MKRQGVGLHEDQAEFIEKIAKKRKVSFSQILREVLQHGIDSLKKKNK